MSDPLARARSVLGREFQKIWISWEKEFSNYFEGKNHGISIDYFQNVLGGWLNLGCAHLCTHSLHSLLPWVEQVVNFPLWNWSHDANRQSQWRSLAAALGFSHHESSLEVTHAEGVTHVRFFMSEAGMSFGKKQIYAPQCLPFSALTVSQCNSLALRKAQREICLLIDEWEFRNAMAASSFKKSISLARNKDEAQAVTLEFDTFRNQFALWHLEQFCAYQSLLNQALVQWSKSDPCAPLEDAQKEAKALQGVLAAAVQKIFLPASVSRLCYHKEVIQNLLRWSVLANAQEPHDISSKLMTIVFAHALVNLDHGPSDANPQKLRAVTGSLSGDTAAESCVSAFAELVHTVARGPLSRWHMQADVAMALKAVAWCLSDEDFGLYVSFNLWAQLLKAPHLRVQHRCILECADLCDMPHSFARRLVVGPLLLPRKNTWSPVIDSLKVNLSKLGFPQTQVTNGNPDDPTFAIQKFYALWARWE